MTAVRRMVVVAGVALVAGVVITLVAAGGGDDRTGPDGLADQSVAGLQQQFVRVVDTVWPAVVEVRTSAGLGSGVVFDTRGDVVTNAHVVGGARTFVATLAGGRQRPATLVGTDRAHDLAVIRLEGARPTPARFADSRRLRVGDIALAVGNPLGLRSSVTQGIVSSLGRTVSEQSGATLTRAIQTSAAINPGNSGGALVDLQGRVIGIPTLTAVDPEVGGPPASGIGFAIPSATAVRVARDLIARTSPGAGRAQVSEP